MNISVGLLVIYDMLIKCNDIHKILVKWKQVIVPSALEIAHLNILLSCTSNSQDSSLEYPFPQQRNSYFWFLNGQTSDRNHFFEGAEVQNWVMWLRNFGSYFNLIQIKTDSSVRLFIISRTWYYYLQLLAVEPAKLNSSLIQVKMPNHVIFVETWCDQFDRLSVINMINT